MRGIKGLALMLIVWLSFTAAACAQRSGQGGNRGGNPLGFMDRAVGVQFYLMLIGAVVVGLVILWGIFKFMLKLMFQTRHDNANVDLGGWKPPHG